MNILWIEDFGGGLSTGTETLELMFQDLLSFDDWNEDEFSYIKRPTDLKKFCERQKSMHCIYLCRNYSDYRNFKITYSIKTEIDVVIIDINLTRNPPNFDFSKKNPEGYNPEKGGCYIFNDLLRNSEASVDKICFMTGQEQSLKDFMDDWLNNQHQQPVATFDKKDSDYKKLREWLDEKNSSYMQLRRGIIEGCQEAEKILNNNKLYFYKYIDKKEKPENRHMLDYFNELKDYLPLNKPASYISFVTKMSKLWDVADNIRPDKYKKDAMLAWIMRNVRHWTTHNEKIYININEELVAYLFIINLRVMFNFDDDTSKDYEKTLFKLFEKNKEKPSLSKNDFNRITSELSAKVKESYDSLWKKIENKEVNKAFYYSVLSNNIQESKCFDLKNNEELFTDILYQMFWHQLFNPLGNKEELPPKDFYKFKFTENSYLSELACHIYNRSFS